jgi:hypothetical protein
MSSDVVAAIKAGALTGSGTLAAQALTGVHMDAGSAVWPMLSALVGGGVAYGVMRATVSALAQEIREVKLDLSEIRRTGTDALVRVAAIEGQMRQIPKRASDA